MSKSKSKGKVAQPEAWHRRTTRFTAEILQHDGVPDYNRLSSILRLVRSGLRPRKRRGRRLDDVTLRAIEFFIVGTSMPLLTGKTLTRPRLSQMIYPQVFLDIEILDNDRSTPSLTCVAMSKHISVGMVTNGRSNLMSDIKNEV
jgi:hypothetical protein